MLRFGLADVVQTLGLSRWSQWRTAKAHRAANADADHPMAQASRPERVRMAIESLGPTFVKLGQILATRSDLLPSEWTQALEQLHKQHQRQQNTRPHQDVPDQRRRGLAVTFGHLDPFVDSPM